MYKFKKKTFNNFVVWISEKEPIFSDQYFHGNSQSNDPEFMKPEIHLVHLLSFQNNMNIMSMPLAGVAAHYNCLTVTIVHLYNFIWEYFEP